jgi:uncharacterized protein YceK
MEKKNFCRTQLTNVGTEMKILIYVLLMVVSFGVSGCASVVSRWVEPAPPYDTGIYRGVRMYMHEIKGEPLAEEPHEAWPDEFEADDIESSYVKIGRGQDVVWGVMGVFVFVDFVLITPVCDTVLLPYDLIVEIMKKECKTQKLEP